MAEQKQDDQLEHTYSSYVRIRDVALKTSQRRWTIGRSGERVQGYPCKRHDMMMMMMMMMMRRRRRRRKKTGVPHLLCRCRTIGNGYVSPRDKTGGSKRTTRLWKAELKRPAQREIGTKSYLKRRCDLLIENINQSNSTTHSSEQAIRHKEKYLRVCAVFLCQPSRPLTYVWVTTWPTCSC